MVIKVRLGYGILQFRFNEINGNQYYGNLNLTTNCVSRLNLI